MPLATFIGYFAGTFLAIDAITNIGTTGHNWALELTCALLFGFASGLMHLSTYYSNLSNRK